MGQKNKAYNVSESCYVLHQRSCEANHLDVPPEVGGWKVVVAELEAIVVTVLDDDLALDLEEDRLDFDFDLDLEDDLDLDPDLDFDWFLGGRGGGADMVVRIGFCCFCFCLSSTCFVSLSLLSLPFLSWSWSLADVIPNSFGYAFLRIESIINILYLE